VPKMFKIVQIPVNVASNMVNHSLFSSYLGQLLGGKG